ncbi:hypothetical protein CIL03_18250 [Virgibacillus indicus]|uniref:Calcineurin-like phosphoesterase domain-containing protein n=1 Tax=Virgibacillus indicus TaxID=2024554 RepID=A0A265N5J2_9BACI|nr:metallophosphoesterase [Virgibacillus indicus]OZU87127.1 hypothetical protein CIL03_18250 [Virgibacillus indicus]
MKKWFMIFTLIILIVISTKIYFDTNDFIVNKVQYQSDKIPEGNEFTVLQISDLHNKSFEKNNEKLINTAENLSPDIIVITGDLIDRSTDDFTNVFSFIKKIVTINKEIYFVTGNHEWENANTEDFLEGLRERNVKILSNQSTQITAENVTFSLSGIDDASTNHEDITGAFQNVDQDLYTILLSHTPSVTEKYEDIPADLILSGHTHGGQVRLPFIGALVAPDQGFLPKFDKGTFKIGQDQYLYIDSGLGTSVAPIRFLNKSQLSLIKITGSSG